MKERSNPQRAKFILIAVVGIVIALVIVAYFFKDQLGGYVTSVINHPRTVVCSEEVTRKIVTVSSSKDEADAKKSQVRIIEANDNYIKDPNCLYGLTQYYLRIRKPAKAEITFNLLKAMTDKQRNDLYGFIGNYSGYVTPLTQNIEQLKKQKDTPAEAQGVGLNSEGLIT